MTVHINRRVCASALIAAALSPTLRAADFNGDGFDDLAAGVPLEDIGGTPVVDAGAVSVVYGSAGGLAVATPAQVWSQNSAGVADAAEAGDLFGGALCSGDFNGDGFDDLAAAAPGEDLPGGLTDAGVVHIIYGSAGAGLSTGFFAPQYFTQTTTGVETSELGDAFGSALCSGDFNGDGFDDLAIGAPGEDSPGGGIVDGGTVIVLYGSGAGLTFGMASNVLFQSVLPAPDGSESGDRFGAALASGDFDGNGADDLAVGSPGEDVGGIADAGAAHVLFGLPGTPLVGFFIAPVFITQGTYLTDPDEAGDRFGHALAAGDFALLGADALAIGAPGEDFSGDADAGMVGVVYGLPGAGLVPFAFPPQVLTQDAVGVPEATDPGDGFGSALSACALGAGVSGDLLVGVPLEDIGAAVDCGAMQDFLGIPGFGLSSSTTIWHQNTAGVAEANGVGDRIGWSIAAGDFNGDGFDDAAAGVPGEDVGGLPIVDAGGVMVIYGWSVAGGLSVTTLPGQFWSQNSAGVPDKCDAGDGMGSAAAPN